MKLTEADVDLTDRDKITTTIEKAAQRLEGVNRESFVDDACLCSSCKWATITRRSSQNNRVIKCGELGQYIPGDITECNQYCALTTMSLGQMADIATLIDLNEPKRVGFHG